MHEAVETGITAAQVLLIFLFGGGAAGGGYLAWRAKARADKAKVAKDSREAAKEHQRDMQKELRLMADYCHELRRQVMNLGGIPEDWPETIRHLV